MSDLITTFARDHHVREDDPAEAARAAALLARASRPRPTGQPPMPDFAPEPPALPWWQSPLGRWVAVCVAGLILATLVLGACRLLALPDWGGAVDGIGYSVRHNLTGRL